MVMKIKLFDEETKGFGSIDLEDGKYVFEIVDVESNAAKSGRGRLQLRCKTTEGPVVGATAFDWWNLPEASDKPDSFPKNFWRDATKAWPFLYDGSSLDEQLLKGLKFRATVTHEERKDKDGKTTGEMQMRMKSYRFLSKTGGEGAVAAASAAAMAAPAKFGQPS